MQKLFFSLLSICIFFTASAQEIMVKGKVVDSASGQPMSKASVFCQNTTYGTATDNDGNFSLQLPNGGYDMVISYTGYEKKLIRISVENTHEPFMVQMIQQDKSLQEVAVVGTSEVADGLTKYGSFFSENFIGTTPNSSKCLIQNPQALKFYYSKKRNRLKVLTKEDLLIANNALGYSIRYQLDSFTYEYATSIATFSGNPLFEEMKGTPEQENEWKLNRLKAYNGSRLHFMRSWHDSALTAQGFVIEKVLADGKDFNTAILENPYDTSVFNRIENNAIEILYNGKIRVKYNKEMPEPAFVQQYKLPAQIRVQLSVLDINEGFVIEENGYFYNQEDVTNTGYWSWEKMADAVPYNYKKE